MRIAVFASGNGSNFQALVEYFREKGLTDQFVWLFCDQPNAYVLERASKLDISTSIFSPKEFQSKKAYEEKILEYLLDKEVDLIVLAGYMRIIGSTLLDQYESRIINIHPSLLPDFPGLHGIRDAFEAGVKKTGVTIHYIDKGVDTGPIICQESVEIKKGDTLEELERRIHQVEHRIYPKVIEQVVKEMKTMEAHIK
ncbi:MULTISPECIES: phosphoribosylglycinamide formyltransferase [Enterococcus]|uniref:phosphoribosylglycinamide formyltransferase n=1 Tax=Enterococcus TaxID=1350 RepID=UPI00110595F4|nr:MULTISPECIES: phosphoribosylglycinamide formyltransferase [Enterococcus]MDB1680196.1 phosphoribosylglycinamide formyltransferase [Enterococcus durans]